MASVTTSKSINLYQFALELDAPFKTLRGGDEWTITADIDQSALEAAVEAHVADPAIAPPPPPAPLVSPGDRIADDELHASVALLTEDSVGYRAIFGLLISKGLVTQAEAAAAIETATRRLVTLADHPDVRRQMIAERLARAEEVRESL